MIGPKAGRKPAHLWLASNPGKRWTEVFFLVYSPFWIAWALCILVPFQLYEVKPGTHMPLQKPAAWDISVCCVRLEVHPCSRQALDEWGYMAIGLCTALPCVVLPALLEGDAGKSKPLTQRYWVKANIWIAIFSFIGNYFWTHYFYDLLGAEYTFPSWRLNEVMEWIAACNPAMYQGREAPRLLQPNGRTISSADG